MNFVYTFVFGEIKKLIEKKRERERRGQAFLDWDALEVTDSQDI